MKNNLLWRFIILLLFVSLPYFIVPYENNIDFMESDSDDENISENNEVIEGFKGGKKSGGRKGGGRKGGGRRGGGRRGGGRRGGGRRGGGWGGGNKYKRRSHSPGFYRRSSYRRYPYYGGYDNYIYPYYSTYDMLSLPYVWGNPYDYGTNYNWFDFRNCPSGCVANSRSPTGFSCVRNDSGFSCQSDYDCSGCNVPSLTLPYY